jgi:hypothetical protein
LGYKIWDNYNKYRKKQKNVVDFRLKFSVPLELLILKFAGHGFFHLAKWGNHKRFVGRRQDKWLYLHSDYDVVYQFNRVINVINDYYAGSTQKSILKRFWFLMRKSCALTIAHRNKRKNACWAFNRYGSILYIKVSKNRGSIRLKQPKVSPIRWFHGIKGNFNNLLNIFWRLPFFYTSSAIVSISELTCVVKGCRCRANIWYKIKRQQYLKGILRYQHMLICVPKQIPLCYKHYMQVFFGKYDGVSLSKLQGYLVTDFI